MADQLIEYKIKADNTQAVQAFNELAKAQGSASQVTQRLGATTQQSNTLLMNTGRIVQDLPFGIMGVGNNITFLAEQFGQAKAQGIGFKESLKGMLGALAGPGGLIFGLSTLITVMTVMSRNTKTGESYTKDFIDTVIKGSTESEAYAKSIGQITKAFKEMTDETITSRIKELKTELTSVWTLLTFQFNKGSYGEKLFGLAQLTKEQESRDLKRTLGLGGDEQGLIQRLQTQIQINTELRDGAQTLSEQAKYQDLINKFQEQLNNQLGSTVKKIEEIKKITATGIYRNEPVAGFNLADSTINPITGRGGDATRKLRQGGGASMAQFSREYAENLKLITSLTMTAADTLRDEFSEAWQDIFGEANSLFEKLIMNIAEQLASRAVTGLFGSFLNFLLPGVGSIAAGALGAPSSPQTTQINLQMDKQTMATWYVGGKTQAARLRMN